MQDHSSYPDPSAYSPGAHGNGVADTPLAATEPYVHPTIPLGLPHVVQFVEASLHHLPMSVRFVGDRLSRYANATGVVSMAIPFICQITGLGSKNTAEHHIRLMESMGILEKKPGKGGKDRKSNTYIFLGEQRNWKPLPTERPGTDPWIALAQARRENEELRAEIAWLKNGFAIGHSGVTDGEEAKATQTTSHSYENADYSASTDPHGAIGHSGVTDGEEAQAPDPTSRSYENTDYSASTDPHGAIGHSGVTDGSSDRTYLHDSSQIYEAPDSEPRSEAQEPEVTNGPSESSPVGASHSYESPDSRRSQRTHEAIGHSEVTNGPDQADEGQEYLSRRARVETLVMKHRTFYQQSFNRRGVLGAIEYFSRSAENEQDLIRQTGILDAGGDPRRTRDHPPPETEAPTQTTEDSDRYAVGECPDCGRPFATHGGASYCTDCTERRRRESEA